VNPVALRIPRAVPLAVIVVLDEAAVRFLDVVIETPSGRQTPDLVRVAPEPRPRAVGPERADARIVINELLVAFLEHAVEPKDVGPVAADLVRGPVEQDDDVLGHG